MQINKPLNMFCIYVRIAVYGEVHFLFLCCFFATSTLQLPLLCVAMG